MYKLVKTFLESKLAVYIQSLKNDHIFPPENSTSRNMSYGSHQMHCRGFIKKDITLLLIVRKKKESTCMFTNGKIIKMEYWKSSKLHLKQFK